MSLFPVSSNSRKNQLTIEKRTSYVFRGLKINQFNWERAFENENVDEKVLTFNKTVLNIFSNFIPDELIVCDIKIRHGLTLR